MSNDKKMLGQYKKLWLKRLCVTVCMVFVMGALKSPAFAATTRTVAIHPSGTSVPGGYDATYTSMSAMHAGENKDLVALDRFLRVEIVNSDGNWNTADTTAVVFDGWKTDRAAGQYLEIEVMSGARNDYSDGKWSTSHYRLSASGITLSIDNDAAANNYFEADFIGLQVETSGANVAARVKDGAFHKVIKFKACHFRNTNATGTEVIQLSDANLAEVWFINSILERITNHPNYSIVRATSAWTATAYFYNCTVVGGGLRGLDVDQGTITVKNCAVFNNGSTDILVLGGATVDYNASDNSVGTNWVDISPAAEVDGWNAAVTDYANGDYRVKDTNSVLYQAGLSQSSDSNVPSEDIAGNARPIGSNPVSIGAFDIPCGTNLVMVTGDGTTNGDADDAIKLALFQSWGWTVTAIDDGAVQAIYDTAAANNDVMYIAESVGSGNVGTKATNLTIPVVVDEDRNWDEFGFASGGTFYETPGTDITILDNSHYITSPFSTGSLSVYSPATDIGSLDGTANFASGITILATRVADQPSLFVADTGAQLIGLTAPARRVGFYTATGDANNFTSNTETLLKRSLGWAAGCGAGGGGTNSYPVLNSIGNKSVDEGQLLQFTISATDPDAGDTLTYSASSLPSGASFDPGTQTFSWTPNVGDAGSYPNVQFTVVDDGTPQGNDSELITITVFVSGGGGLPAPDLNEYSCNMKITIDNTKVAGSSPHSNFPVLISLTDDSLKNTGCAIVTDSNGYDIIFVDSTKTIQLYHEIEKYDGAAGEFVSWVRIPTLSATSDTDIYLYYGNINVSSSQENPTDVWDSNYTMVYHLNEPSGTSGSDSVTDSTGNTGGTPSAGISFGQSGRIGDSADFSSGTGISLGSIGSSLLAADATVSFWLYSNNIASPARQNPFDQAYGGWGTMTLETAGVMSWFFGSDGGNASPYANHGSGGGLVTNGSWIYVVGVRNSSGYTYDWYKNGAYVNGSTYDSSYPVINTRTFTIGDGYVNPINGRIDEFRISNTPRSADWIQTSYNNQNDPSSFYNIVKDCSATAPPISEFTCSLPITIDSTKVSGSTDFTDFPVLIDLTDVALKATAYCGSVLDSNGYDIIFSDSTQTTQLDHEMVSYDGAAGTLVAWVRVPTLSATVDTVINVHFGHASVCGSTENPAGVWDSSYKGVWHLKDLTTSSTKDSTAYINHGTKKAAGEPAEVADNIGKVQNFDGTDDYIDISLVSNDVDVDQGTFELWLKREFGGGGGSCVASPTVYSTAVSTTYTVPAGCDTLTVKAWGAGGAGGGADTGNGGAGGGGGYASSAISVTPGEDLSIEIGGGGAGGPGNGGGAGGDGGGGIPSAGGGAGATATYSGMSGGGGGGGYATVKRSSTFLVIAAGGGGGGGGGNGSSEVGGAGGAGGGTNGVAGAGGGCGGPGGSGTQSAGGAGGSGSGCTGSAGTAGSQYTGGDGGNNAGGGGGSGYYGGGGGQGDDDGGAGGGGGSGLGDTLTAGSGTSAGNNGDTDYANSAGQGGAAGLGTHGVGGNGNPGRIVLIPSGSGGGATTSSIMRVDTDSQNRITFSYDEAIDMFRFRHEAGDTETKVERAVSEIPQNTWTHVAMTWDKNAGASGEFKAYISGSQVGSTLTGLGTWVGTVAYGDLGRRYDDTEYYDGSLDEARISSTARSADWIQTAYTNQSNPSSFYSVGTSGCALGGFSCSRRITIDSTKVMGSSDLTNFPLLIKTQNDCNLKAAANGGAVQNSNGWDIMFTDSDGVTQLDHEIEEYDGITGNVTAWVRIPTLPDNSDKDIYMYYGKSGLTCDPSNPTGVWDSSYEAVYHLNDNFEDSTSHNRDATAEDTDTYTSVIADGEDFGPQDEISVGNWNFSGDELTLQAWARFDDLDQDDPRVISKGIDPAGGQDHVFMLSLGGTLEQYLRLRVKTGTDDLSGTTELVDTTDPVSAGNWYLVAGTYDGANMRLLKNGLEVASLAKTGNLRQNSWPVALGNHPGSADTLWGSLDGKLDEVRILSAARSAAWLETEYNNQSNPDSFYTMSQDTCGGVFGFNFQYCKKITVDNTQVDSDLTDFPLLINITNDDDLKTVANGGRVEHSQGYDIVFRTSGCGNLEHEIEKYDGDNGDLVAWVSVPTLSSTTPDTEIYLYYGANVICSTENPTAVWDSSYTAVWHLKEDPSGTAPQTRDSTANDNDGTSNGSMTTADLVSGKIGNGIDFDGSNDWIESPNSGSLDITGNAITLSAWVKSTADQNDDAGIINKSYSADYNYMLNVQSSDQGNFRVRTGGTSTYLTGSTALTAGQWYFLYGIYDGANAKVYLNGSEDGTDIRAGNIESSGAAPVVLGRRRVYPTADDRFFTGVIDEARISNVARSVDWMKTEFRNQNDPGNFYTVGSCFEQTTSQTNEWKEEFQ